MKMRRRGAVREWVMDEGALRWRSTGVKEENKEGKSGCYAYRWRRKMWGWVRRVEGG